VIGGGMASSFPLPLSSDRQGPSAEDDLIAEKRRKRAVAQFMALTTSSAAAPSNINCSLMVSSLSSSPLPPPLLQLPSLLGTETLLSQTLDRIIRVATNMEQELLREYKPQILNTREVRSDELVAKIVQAVEVQIPPPPVVGRRKERVTGEGSFGQAQRRLLLSPSEAQSTVQVVYDPKRRG
jgi:hypothetical protein